MMKKSVAIILLVLGVFTGMSSAVEVTLLGPHQYIRTSGTPDVFSDAFIAYPGSGTLIVINGKQVGDRRIIDAISSAEVFLNGELIFGPNDFNKNVYLLEAPINLIENNSIIIELASQPDSYITVEVIADIDPPTVTFSADPATIFIGESSTLSWQTNNADSCVIEPDFGTVDVNGFITVSPAETITYSITAIGLGGTATTTATVTVLHPPTVEISANPAAILSGESSTLSWSSTYADSATIDQGIGPVPVNGSTSSSSTETTTYTITVIGPGGTASANTTVTVEQPSGPPTVNFSVSPATIQQGESALLSWSSVNAQSANIDKGIGVVDPNSSISVSLEHTTTYTISATGPTGSAGAHVTVMVLGNPEPQPEGHFGEQYEDLVPPDATVESYDPGRFSLITGLVQDPATAPIADVSITIHSHPEYGTAATDAEGRFSIPVEGGTTITVVYQKNGLISAHRKVHVPWNDTAIAETIQMIAEDPVSTEVTFDGDPATVVTHQSTVITDEFGSRTATMVFTGDNRAYLVDENGNDVQELTTITTRATEYATPESMPAVLPPTSAYTYCVELGVDGAQRVRFEKPVLLWVDNFLDFDVGLAVPVGVYDRDRGVWVPEKNGRVVRLLDTDSDGVVDALDADGDDLPDDLNENGSFIDEVKGLEDAQKYQSGATFWRVAVNHFSPHDLNWARRVIASYTPLIPQGPEGSIASNSEGIPSLETSISNEPITPPEKDKCLNSYVENRSRIFHEDIAIPGTDLALHYAGNRVEGYRHGISVPASGDTVPDGLKRIVVEVEVAGRKLEQLLPPLPNQKADLIWDGLDQLGRRVNSSVTAEVNIGFVYDAVYTVPPLLETAFAMAGGDLTSIMTREEVTLWKRSEIAILVPPIIGKNRIAEGWSLSPHHYVSPSGPSTLYKGDGSIKANNLNIIATVAGNGIYGFSGDGGPATAASLFSATGVSVDSAGNIYIADRSNHRIRKVDTSGIITTVAGNGFSGFSGDGGPATAARLNYPHGVSVDSAGNIYIAEYGNHRIRKVDTGGIITTVAGNGIKGFSGDGGPATAASLNNPIRVSVDSTGNIYIADVNNHRLRKVDTGGIITTVAGNGILGFSGDGGAATAASLNRPLGVSVDSAGNIYIADRSNHRIRKVDTGGIITTVAGNGILGFSGDGGAATAASLGPPYGVSVDSAGNIYIADGFYNHRLRKVDTGGIITTVAGNGNSAFSGDGGPATTASLNPSGVSVDSAGNIYIADTNNRRILKVAPPSRFAGFMIAGDIPFSEENGLGHIMDSAGRHNKTFDLDTGQTLYEFGYDPDKNLVSITDRFGNQTTIARDVDGVPTSITSPDGITTTLTIDSNNHLTQISYPDGSYYGFEYTPDGLMTAEIEPEGNRFEHLFDALGRLTDVTDQEGGNWNYSRTAFTNGDIRTEGLSAEGNLTTILDHTYSTGAYTSTVTDSTGAETFFSQSADGLTVNQSLPCGMELESKYDIDPEYKFKYVKEMKQRSPSGLELVTAKSKTYEDTDADDVPDLVTETVSVNGKTTTLAHKTLQAQKVVTSPEGRTVTSLYNPNNLLTESISVPGLSDTLYGYDPRGRLTSISTDTRQTAFSYNVQGFLESVTDPENHSTTYSYDAVGRITGISRPDGGFGGFTYDKNGNMTVLTTPVDVDHGFGFNSVNRNSSYQTPLSGSYSYIYDRDRRLIQTNFPSGKAIINDYADPSNPDDKSRLWQIRTPEGNIDFTYLCGTKVESITKGTESITYGYDGKLLISEALAGTLNQSVIYTYNNDFDVSSFTYAGGTTNYSYDNDRLLAGSGSFTITRNADNGLPENVAGGALDLARTFNGYGEVDSQAITVNSQNVASWTLIRDNNGRITQKTETVNGVISNYLYTYDSMGRLLTVTKDGILVEDYGYDLSGTRISETNTLRGIAARSFSYSDEDHLLSAESVTYAYDLDGFLTTKTEGGDVTTYSYSSRGELISVNLPDGRTIEYIHDPLGRRIAKKIDGVIIEKYLWQGLTRLLAVYDGFDNLLMRFDFADSRMPVAVNAEGVTYYLTYDQVGSLRTVADSSGNVVKSIQYDSFGNILDDSNPSFVVPFGFAGGLHDQDTGLVRFGYRDYDPDIGRWTAKDPIFFNGGDTDLYGYVLNDPVNLIDPLGLIRWGTVGKGALATFGGSVAVVTGALVSTTGAGAIGGVPAVLVGSAGVGWGVSQMVAGFLDNEIPFMGTKEAIIKGTTEPGLLQDELLGANALGDMLLTRRTAPTDVGKINDVMQSGYSIYESGSKIMGGNSGSSPCP